MTREDAPGPGAAEGVGLLVSDRFLEHDPGRGHPERPHRLEAVWERLDKGGLLGETVRLEPEPAERAWLRAVHPLSHLEALEAIQAEARREGTTLRIDPDTLCGPRSYDTAVLAAGGVLVAARAVADASVRRAFCAVRPPGHHAERRRAMGFCLVNHVAVAARWLVEARDFERIFVLDWDVHHGNGTQDVFYEDGSVFYLSLHQRGIYPGTGHPEERGRGSGEGTTLNLPLEGGGGDDLYLAQMDGPVAEAVEAFRPEMILVSAGFDAHRADPLAGMEVTRSGFEEMTRRVVAWAEEHAEGRIVSVLEGGYDLEALASCVEGHLEALF